MQSGPVPPRPSEDIQSILSRFQAWSGKDPAKSSKSAREGVREVSMDEAIQQVRQRRTSRGAATRAAEPLPEEPQVSPAKPESRPAPAAAAPAVEAAAGAKAEARPRAIPAAKKKPEQPRASTPARKATKRSAAAAIPPAARRKSSTRGAAQSTRAAAPVFREVLTRTVQQETPAKERGADRQQRVSVRLSRQEEQRLQTLASKSGVTVSEYLRRCSLAGETPRATRAPAESAKAAAADVFESAPAKASVLGDWLSLLRHRFLASPQRIAERA